MSEGERLDREAASGSRSLQPGDRLGPYRIERPLGRGGMGEVVAAYDQRLDRRVAIKRIRQDPSTDRDVAGERERLRREARAAAALSHPAIVQIHDILTEDAGDAIVMELVDGRSVAELLKAGPLPLNDVVRLGRQVAEGLAEAHRLGLVHRDLKAENVMVTTASDDHPGRAKILDFGLVKALQGPAGKPSGGQVDQTLTREGAVLGTVRAMSPEQAQGGEVDHRSDLFSLGVLLYEMLTGRSPFRGANAVETFRRLLIENPRPIRALRPAAPATLETLVIRLLKKKPSDRPDDAREVVRALADLADLVPVAEAPEASSASLSDVPTGSFLSPSPPRAAAGNSIRPHRQHRRGAAILLAAAVAVAALAAVTWHQSRGGSVPLRVVVMRPELVTTEPSADLDRVASGVLIAALGTLADLEGLAPVEPSAAGDGRRAATAVARAAAADEVLSTTVERYAGNARVALRRIRASDGEVLWAGSFDASLRRQSAWTLAEAVAVQIQQAYPARQPLRGTRREASDGDYAEFVEISQRIESGNLPWEPELSRLETLSERAPRFLSVHLQGVETAWTLYTDTDDAHYLRRGEQLLARAQELAPGDPVLIYWSFRLALAHGDLELARAELAKFAASAPNDVKIPLCRSNLAEREGDLDGAAAAMREAVERAPSWRNLHRLASLELRRGQVDDARRILEQLLERVPESTWGLAKLAQLELAYGDLERAEILFLELIGLKTHRSYLTNLGLTRFLRGRYQEAKASYLEALAIQPGHLTVSLNLADTELALGEETNALARYRRIVEELEQQNLDADGSMRLAQCLARLGEDRRAVTVTLEALQQYPDDAEVAYAAALVYALVGETYSALANVEKALARGIKPRWFRIPGFDALASDPRFRSSVADSGNGSPP